MSSIIRPQRAKKKNQNLNEYLDDDMCDDILAPLSASTDNLSRKQRAKKPTSKHRTNKQKIFQVIVESNPIHLSMIKLCKNGNEGTERDSTRFIVGDIVYVVHDTPSGKNNFRGKITRRVIYKWASKGQEVRYDVEYDDKDKGFGCWGKFIY